MREEFKMRSRLSRRAGAAVARGTTNAVREGLLEGAKLADAVAVKRGVTLRLVDDLSERLHDY